MNRARIQRRCADSSRSVLWNDGLAVRPMKARQRDKDKAMNEQNAAKQAGTLGLTCKSDRDPMQQMTCGENLERKISDQRERLAMLETALEEMKTTGLYNVKISTLRDTMTW